jgi:hypothetical protein
MVQALEQAVGKDIQQLLDMTMHQTSGKVHNTQNDYDTI